MSEISRHLQSAEQFYCFQDGKKNPLAHWGAQQSGPASLALQQFYSPLTHKGSTSLWTNFPQKATWSLKESRQFEPSELGENSLLPFPKSKIHEEKNSWIRFCEKISLAIESKKIAEKLVPARMISVSLESVEYATILDALPGRLFSLPMENSYRFLVKSGESIFFGATPELLFRREKGQIFVPAIAGTRALAKGPEADLREELLGSQKEREEHAYVVEGICQSLRKLGLEPIHPSAPEILRVPRLLHLYTPIFAPDRPGLPAEEILQALHPTPAIAGIPQKAALEFLREEEPWDRGLFSAPLLFRESGLELCLVAIRSALLTPNQLYFFAGAGYVKGSTPEAEWDETERKLQVMQALLFEKGQDGKKF